ncbi:MAG: SoxR reducing system RseC family protein [Gammaproteobacteria bacterium]|nr:SoxR reducing system RseC family protein [Gammaproteobacteria bacterium]
MIVRRGRITANDGELIGIRAELPVSCAACGDGGGCGALALASLFGRLGPAVVQVQRPPGQQCRIGDRVTISISERKLLRLSVIAYLLPVASLVLGAWLGETIAPPATADLWSATGGALGLAAAVAILRLCERISPQYGGACQVCVAGQRVVADDPLR